MIEINNRTKAKLNKRKIEEAVSIFLKKNKKGKKDVSIAIIGDKKMKEFNKKYRGIDKITDILSFKGEENFLGELIINYAQIKRQAKKFSNTPDQEFIFILIHGLLHLIGFDDKTEKDREFMIKKGEDFIKENIKK
jgi:probable rRNA maturation factor